MAKEILRKELVYLNFKTQEARFFNIEVLSVGYNQMQVITTNGTFNNKGRVSIHRFDGENAFKEANKLAYKKMFEKKSEGFAETSDVAKWHDAFNDKQLDAHLKAVKKIPDIKMKKSKPNWTTPEKTSTVNLQETRCNLCDKYIKKEIYNKIDDWGRGEGNWDANKDFIGFQKVLCLDCQIEHDIFKKKC